LLISLPQTDAGPGADLWSADVESLAVREIHHRLMNILMIVAGQLRRERDEPEREARAAIDRAIQMLCAHGQLQAALIDYAPGATSVPDYVERLCRRLSDAILEPAGIRCETRADEGMLPASCMQALGLIIHELALNTVKHAFDGPGGGVVRVEVLQHSGSWSCTVTDNGRGLATTHASQGAGGRIIKGLVDGLRGSMAVRSCGRGVSVTVMVPKAS
jgi:two-component sensor histidine kinase